MGATNEEIENMAKELYNELGGLRTKNGRIVRALLHKWKDAELQVTALETAVGELVTATNADSTRRNHIPTVIYNHITKLAALLDPDR